MVFSNSFLLDDVMGNDSNPTKLGVLDKLSEIKVAVNYKTVSILGPG